MQIDNIVASRQEEQLDFILKANNTNRKYPDNVCIHNLFEEQVQKTPDALAIVYEQTTMTYAELNYKANQLSYHLMANGVTNQSLVGIMIDNSPDMIISLLAVLKCGAGYVPLDVSYPSKRLAHMISNADIKLILTTAKLQGKVALNIKTILVDNQACYDHYLNTNPQIITSSQAVIYGLFTSGSTGLPKGVKLIHKAVSNLLSWYTERCDINQHSRILIISSFSFDLTQKNILGGLIAGAQIHLVNLIPFDSRHIVDTIYQQKITFINCTPSTFYSLIDEHIYINKLSSLSKIALGGEPIDTKRLISFIKVNPSAKIINTYGPTECTDIVCAYNLTEEDIIHHKSIPLGHVIQNTKMIILDDNMQPSGPNAVGEAYIGGLGVGLGYMHNQTLTEERFITHPIASLRAD